MAVDSPKYNDWQQVLDLLQQASAQQRDQLLFKVLLTHDEIIELNVKQ